MVEFSPIVPAKKASGAIYLSVKRPVYPAVVLFASPCLPKFALVALGFYYIVDSKTDGSVSV